MFVGVVALRYQHRTTQSEKTRIFGSSLSASCIAVLITKCHNSHKHSQSPLTNQRAKFQNDVFILTSKKNSINRYLLTQKVSYNRGISKPDGLLDVTNTSLNSSHGPCGLETHCAKTLGHNCFFI